MSDIVGIGISEFSRNELFRGSALPLSVALFVVASSLEKPARHAAAKRLRLADTAVYSEVSVATLGAVKMNRCICDNLDG